MDTDTIYLLALGIVAAALAGAATYWLSPPKTLKSAPFRPLRLLLTILTLIVMGMLIIAGQGLIAATLLPIVVCLFIYAGKRNSESDTKER